jgi:threonine/homoserine efflux transporter RhtA
LSPPERAQRALGRWLVFMATLCWGTTATLARSVFRDGGVPAQTVVELRLVIAAGLLLAWMLARNRGALRIERADRGALLVLGLFGVAAVQGTYYYSIAKLGVGARDPAPVRGARRSSCSGRWRAGSDPRPR